jgi:hypothetical protein
MVDLPTVKKEMIMKKFTFTVELVGESVDVDTVTGILSSAVDGIATYHAVDAAPAFPLTEQGLKVWAKRKAGVSLAAPKPVKAPKAPKAEVAETVEA